MATVGDAAAVGDTNAGADVVVRKCTLISEFLCVVNAKRIYSVHLCVETLGDPYCKRVPLPRFPEYRNLGQDSQLSKPTVKFAAVEPNIISNYLNGYHKIFGRRRLPTTPSCELLSYARYRHNIYLAP